MKNKKILKKLAKYLPKSDIETLEIDISWKNDLIICRTISDICHDFQSNVEIEDKVTKLLTELCTNHFSKKKTKSIWVCSKCGSDNVEVRLNAYVRLNNVIGDLKDSYDNDFFCVDCETESKPINIEINSDIKVIGFQAIGMPNTDVKGKPHPDMKSIYSVYNLSQIKKMLDIELDIGNSGYRLSTVWSNMFKSEPEIMFEGNPRN
jgi:hypothetical protein